MKSCSCSRRNQEHITAHESCIATRKDWTNLFALLQLSAWYVDLFQFVPVDRRFGQSCDGFANETFQV
jgi:hypothetical protein